MFTNGACNGQPRDSCFRRPETIGETHQRRHRHYSGLDKSANRTVAPRDSSKNLSKLLGRPTSFLRADMEESFTARRLLAIAGRAEWALHRKGRTGRSWTHLKPSEPAAKKALAHHGNDISGATCRMCTVSPNQFAPRIGHKPEPKCHKDPSAN